MKSSHVISEGVSVISRGAPVETRCGLFQETHLLLETSENTPKCLDLSLYTFSSPVCFDLGLSLRIWCLLLTLSTFGESLIHDQIPSVDLPGTMLPLFMPGFGDLALLLNNTWAMSTYLGAATPLTAIERTGTELRMGVHGASAFVAPSAQHCSLYWKILDKNLSME